MPRRHNEDLTARVLDAVAHKPYLSTREIAELLGISWNTAHNHLRILLRRGVVKRRQRGRVTRWVLRD